MFRNNKGFTLIELMVVIAIISTLMALLVPDMIKQADQSKEKRAKVEVTLMKSIIDAYYVENGEYPKDSNDDTDAAAIISVLVDNGIKWGVLEDPWGRGYKYDTDDALKEYAIYSYGPTDASKDGDCILAKNDTETQLNQNKPEQLGTTDAVSSK